MLDSLNEHIIKGAPCYVERAIKPVFQWDEVVALLQYCADEGVGNPIGILNYKLPEAEKVQGIQLVREYLNENLDSKIANAQLCVTLTTSENPSYKNDCGILLWATHGLTEFSFGEDEDKVVRLLQPGDLVYVPKELPFKMTPLNARVFVSFGLEEQREKDDN